MTLLMSFIFLQKNYAQVGIGTTNPLQELHIAGTTSTIRVEGLNSINNSNNNGTDLASLAVDTNGDIKIREAIYGDNIQYVVLPSGTQNINTTYLTDITGASITFTPKHDTVYLSFAISGYNPLCYADQQSYFVVGVSKNGSNIGNFLSLTATNDDSSATGAATVTAANYPISVTAGTPVTIKLQGRDGGSVHDCGFDINKTDYTSYLTILD